MAVQKCVTAAQKKAVQVKAEQNFLEQLLVLSQEQNIDFYQLFTFPLSPVPWSLATADGTFVKTDKSQLLRILEAESTQPDNALPYDSVFVVGGNAILHSFAHLLETLGDLAWTVFQLLPKGHVMHFVTDSYQPCSIKDAAKCGFYRAANSIFGKVGHIASEEVVIHLLKTKCVPILLYRVEALPLNKSQLNSLDFVVNCFFMKLFKTSDIKIVEICREQFNFALPSVQLDRRCRNFDSHLVLLI